MEREALDGRTYAQEAIWRLGVYEGLVRLLNEGCFRFRFGIKDTGRCVPVIGNTKNQRSHDCVTARAAFLDDTHGRVRHNDE